MFLKREYWIEAWGEQQARDGAVFLFRFSEGTKASGSQNGIHSSGGYRPSIAWRSICMSAVEQSWSRVS